VNDLHLDHIEHADAISYLRTLPDGCVNCVVTSPPYFGLRDYGTATWDGGDPACDHVNNAGATKKFGNPEFNENRPSREETKTAGYYAPVCPKCGAIRIDSQIGLEPTPGEYVAALVEVFREVRRVMRPDAVAWVNLGDSFGPNKQLQMIPARFAIAMQDDGWVLRADIIWAKPNPMPESVTDRPTRSHEYIFLLAKGPKYWYDAAAVSEPTLDVSLARAMRGTGGDNKNVDGAPGQNKHSVHQPRKHGEGYPINTTRNRRTVWTITPANYADAHFATFPEAIPEICIKAGCPEGGVVLDIFMGAGTTALVAKKLNRRYLGCDLNADYVRMAIDRVDGISYTLFSLMEVTGD
jgi:DNA modification methylase